MATASIKISRFGVARERFLLLAGTSNGVLYAYDLQQLVDRHVTQVGSTIEGG
jgi:hypothetical protein